MCGDKSPEENGVLDPEENQSGDLGNVDKRDTENIHKMKPSVCHHQPWKNSYLGGKVRHVKEMRKIKIVSLLECEKYG